MKRFIIPTLALLAFSGCYNDKAELLYPTASCDTSSVTFSGVVGPILQSNCAAIDGCHMTKDASLSGGVSLDNYAGAKTVALNGQLMLAITHDPTVVAMPKDRAKLDDCTIRKIGIWVEQGAPNN
jgi:hypothetical protein